MAIYCYTEKSSEASCPIKIRRLRFQEIQIDDRSIFDRGYPIVLGWSYSQRLAGSSTGDPSSKKGESRNRLIPTGKS